MANILKEKVTNPHGVKWLRTHAVDTEGNALCFTPEYSPEMEEGIGQISCVDCVSLIEHCQKISKNDLTPEYQNEMFNKRPKK